MPDTNMIDEVVNERPATKAPGRSVSARPVVDESVAPDGKAKTERSNIVDENHSGTRNGRAFKDSTEKLLAKMEKEDNDEAPRKPAPHEEGDPDEDEIDRDEASEADGDADDDAGEDDADAEGDADGDEAAAGDGEEGDEDEGANALNETAARLEARNRELVTELETARKTPKAERTERETALVAAEASYYDEGSVSALRKFLSVIVGAAPDSKEVDAELSGIYTDLTARELGVTLDQNQQALRDNARTRLLLARDKREKVEASKKPAPDNSAEAVSYEAPSKYIDNLLTTKNQAGTSYAEEFPMLMSLAEDFDGYKPSEVIARAIRREYETGSLDPKTSEIDALRSVASKIEKYYTGIALKIKTKLKTNKNHDTTTPSGKTPKVAVEARTEQRRSTGAPTITTTTASRAPAKPPKIEKQKARTTNEKSRKDFTTDKAWREHLLSKHFTS